MEVAEFSMISVPSNCPIIYKVVKEHIESKNLDKIKVKKSKEEVVCISSRLQAAIHYTLMITFRKWKKKLYLEIITGVKELDEFDRFVEEWMEAGGDQITLEVTEAVREAKGA